MDSSFATLMSEPIYMDHFFHTNAVNPVNYNRIKEIDPFWQKKYDSSKILRKVVTFSN